MAGHLSWSAWLALSWEERAAAVAHRRVHNAIEAHYMPRIGTN